MFWHLEKLLQNMISHGVTYKGENKTKIFLGSVYVFVRSDSFLLLDGAPLVTQLDVSSKQSDLCNDFPPLTSLLYKIAKRRINKKQSSTWLPRENFKTCIYLEVRRGWCTEGAPSGTGKRATISSRVFKVFSERLGLTALLIQTA